MKATSIQPSCCLFHFPFLSSAKFAFLYKQLMMKFGKMKMNLVSQTTKVYKATKSPRLGCAIIQTTRAKRTGPEGLRAESARAVTGRRCPHSGKGEDSLTGQLNFFTETAVTPERKVKQSIPRWEINHHAKG